MIPAYNEEQRLPASLERVAAYLDAQPWPAEMVVVDDGSSDGTPRVVEAAAAKNPRSGCCATRPTTARATPSATVCPARWASGC